MLALLAAHIIINHRFVSLRASTRSRHSTPNDFVPPYSPACKWLRAAKIRPTLRGEDRTISRQAMIKPLTDSLPLEAACSNDRYLRWEITECMIELIHGK